MWNNRLPSAFASQLAEAVLAGGAGSALFIQAAEAWWAPPSSPDQVLESSGAGRRPANCNGGIAASQGQFRNKKKLRLAAAEAEKWAASKKREMQRLQEGQMKKEVWLMTRHRSPHVLGAGLA